MAWLFKQAASKCWWIGYRLNGRQFRSSTGTNDREEAEKVLASLRMQAEAARAEKLNEDFYHQITSRPLSRKSLNAAVTDWLAEAKGSTAANTFERYSDVSKALLTFLKADGEQPLLSSIEAGHAQAFLDSIRARSAVSTANLYRNILSGFFKRCMERQLIKLNPCLPVKRYKASKRESTGRRPFTLAEVKLMLEKAPSDFWRYMILGGFFTGLRLGDLITMTWGNVDLESKFIRLSTGKTDTRVVIPIRNPNFLAALRELRRQAGTVKPGDCLWPEQAARYAAEGSGRFSNEFYDEVLLAAGLVNKRTKKKQKQGRDAAREIGKVSFHSLRHTFVSLLKVTGATQSTAKELAGHSSDEVSQLYTHTPEAALVEAIEAIPDPTK